LIAAIIVCIVGAFQLKNSVEIGWLLIVGTVVYGALSTLVLFAIADGILLAINAASDLSAIRQHLATTQRPSDN
jgi:hypothetical protein